MYVTYKSLFYLLLNVIYEMNHDIKYKVIIFEIDKIKIITKQHKFVLINILPCFLIKLCFQIRKILRGIKSI